MESIYTADATFFEVDEVATGYEAVNTIIQNVLEKMPADFVFHATQPAMINHNVGRFSWGVGPANGQDVVTGTDVALFRDGRIQALYVFLDTGGA